MGKFFETELGEIWLENSLDFLATLPSETVDLIVLSPPFALLRKKEYGNKNAENYTQWFLPFAYEMMRVLKASGSLFIEIGGSWVRGQPTRTLYRERLLIALCDRVGFHLAQDLYWYNTAKLPTPAQWVTIERVRLKDAVSQVWWLSKSPSPKADNKNVLLPYSASQKRLMETTDKESSRPSGHTLSGRFDKDNGGSIRPNILAVSNTRSNTLYLQQCKKKGIRPHPARMPFEIAQLAIEQTQAMLC